MAHSDALIFLTNITWIFFLFLFLYFGFALFFLPTLYKKFRMRVLCKRETYRNGLYNVKSLLGGIGLISAGRFQASTIVSRPFKLFLALIYTPTNVTYSFPKGTPFWYAIMSPFCSLNRYDFNFKCLNLGMGRDGVLFVRYRRRKWCYKWICLR